MNAMVLRLQYLKYQTKGKRLTPYFLRTPDDNEVPQKLLAYLESSIGKPRSMIDFESPKTWVPDSRIIRALLATALSRFYQFESRELKDLVSKTESKHLQRQGISNLEDLRIWFWEWIQREQSGFIPRENRQEIINTMSKQLQLNPVTLTELLVAHRDEHTILQRQNDMPSTAQFISAYNFEVLETLLYNSDSITLTIQGGSLGSAARALLKYTKRFGVIVDLESSNDTLRAIIVGPRVFFGRASSFGWNIAQVLTRLLLEAPSLDLRLLELTIDVILRDRPYSVQLTSSALPSLLPRGEPRADEAFLDSKVEAQFFWSWHNNKFRGWDIVREPDVFTIQSHLIIPDFALVKDNQKVLVEIIGYWREEYTQKKRAQMALLYNLGLKDMILLVDNKHRRYFKKFVYPIVFYRLRGKRYEIPYGKILKALPQ